MCQSMADIQSTAAEIRRGKKDRRKKKKETTGQKYNGPLLHRAAINTDCTDGLNVKKEKNRDQGDSLFKVDV